ncbi:hypothetical protein VNO78_23862 [Psophocarpus tetragonolobus]|uniref:Uncharacterized protein n=1 Tax=Psophocarpus tetragonolobus TaxID=3891 RepID=A0AAN9S4S3_PSOTE
MDQYGMETDDSAYSFIQLVSKSLSQLRIETFACTVVVLVLMALREILVMGIVVLVCLAKVSSDAEIGKEEKDEEVGFSGDELKVRDGNRRLMQEIDCGGLCKGRCSEHSRPNVCHRACGTCCVRCKCVPPGTSGNRELCGTCYTDMTTHANKTKCP